jgi:hypothetical protein
MSRFRAPARLLWRRPRRHHHGVWIIRDGGLELSTGTSCQLAAERMLAMYLAAKHEIWLEGAIQSLREQMEGMQPPMDVCP